MITLHVRGLPVLKWANIWNIWNTFRIFQQALNRIYSTFYYHFIKEYTYILTIHSKYIYLCNAYFLYLTAGEKYPNLHVHFEHKLTNIDIDTAKMVFTK